MMPEAILRVGRHRFSGRRGRLPPCGRCDQHPHELLQRPALLHEADGEEVEQFGMGGTVAQVAEIVRRANEALAEKMEPHAVDEDTRGQGIAGIRDRLCHVESSARVSGRPGRDGLEKADRAPRHVFTRFGRVAAEGERGIRRLVPVLQSADRAIRLEAALRGTIVGDERGEPAVGERPVVEPAFPQSLVDHAHVVGIRAAVRPAADSGEDPVGDPVW